MTNRDKADRAHGIVLEIKSVILNRTKDVFSLGKFLKEIRDEELYLVLGYDSFLEFIADPEISFQKTTAYAYIQLYECFVEKYNVDFRKIGKIPYSKLLKIMKYVDETNIDTLIGLAMDLVSGDLDEEIEFLGLKKNDDGEVIEYRTRGIKLFEKYRKLPAADRSDFDKEYRRFNEIEERSHGEKISGGEISADRSV